MVERESKVDGDSRDAFIGCAEFEPDDVTGVGAAGPAFLKSVFLLSSLTRVRHTELYFYIILPSRPLQYGKRSQLVVFSPSG